MPVKILEYKQGIFCILFLFLLSLPGLDTYSGSVSSYLFFDISWLMVLFSALCLSQSYTIFYIQIMLFLGFWLKLMFHLILGVFFVEPTGYWKHEFFASPSSWNHVLIVSSLAACGILCANILFFYVSKNKNKKNKSNITSVPLWYSKHSKFAWNTLLFVALVVSVFNIVCQLCITGLQPQMVLPWHLNALIIGIMVIAIPLSMSTFFGWDNNLQQQKRFYRVCALAFIISISIASRAIYLFWTLPFVLVAISSPQFSFKNVSLRKHGKLIGTYLLFAILTLTIVSVLRVHYYELYQLQKEESLDIGGGDEEEIRPQGKFYFRNYVVMLEQIQKLFVGRWVGIEGVMATTAYQHSGWPLLKTGVLEKPGVGDVGIYTHIILKPDVYHNTKKTMFSSLPGLVGILNYANSLWLIFFGVTGCCLLLCCIELFSNFVLRSTFLLSQQGLILGYWCVSGLNIPYLGMINLFECFSVILLLSAINPIYNFFVNYPSRKSLLNSHKFKSDNLSI